GICIWVLSGFTLLCLAMALCLGIFVEFIAYLDSMDTRAEQRAALRRWQAAYYCGPRPRLRPRRAPDLPAVGLRAADAAEQPARRDRCGRLYAAKGMRTGASEPRPPTPSGLPRSAGQARRCPLIG